MSCAYFGWLKIACLLCRTRAVRATAPAFMCRLVASGVQLAVRRSALLDIWPAERRPNDHTAFQFALFEVSHTRLSLAQLQHTFQKDPSPIAEKITKVSLPPTTSRQIFFHRQ